MRFFSIIIYLFLSAAVIFAQTEVKTINAFIAYAYPNEEGIRIGEKGVTKWTNAATEFELNFYATNTGELNLALNATAANEAEIEVSINGQKRNVKFPLIDKNIGSFKIEKAGFYPIRFKGLSKSGEAFPDVQSVELTGSATQDIQFNTKNWRRAPAVHLNFKAGVGEQYEWLFNEVSVPKEFDIIGTYPQALGFDGGYFGIQNNSPTERRVIFSVWDAKSNSQQPKQETPPENKAKLVEKGANVMGKDFGHEGTGVHTHWVFSWKPDVKYRFLLRAEPKDNSTIYTAFFNSSEFRGWKMIAKIERPVKNGYFTNFNSFLENFDIRNGYAKRKVYIHSPFAKKVNGDWRGFSEAKFTVVANGANRERIDFGGGVENGSFYLWTGGFVSGNAKINDIFSLPIGKMPAEAVEFVTPPAK